MLFGKKNHDTNTKSDWVTEIADHIERVVDGIRDKAVVPLTTIARGLVYGLLATIVGLAALVILAITFVRMLDIYLGNIPGAPDGVWLADLVAGAIFVIAGVLLWSKRHARHTQG